MGRLLVMGDIHGAHKALIQVLERCGFNNEEDTLVQLGDIVDGWSESYECVEELLKIKNLIPIKGNHDQWFLQYIGSGLHPAINHGAVETVQSYIKNCPVEDSDYMNERGHTIPESHQKFFRNQVNYYHTDDNIVFVHGGYTSHRGIGHEHYPSNYYWDRTLWETALTMRAVKNGLVIKDMGEDYPERLKHHKEIFIGHTNTVRHGTDKPIFCGNLINMDTGAGFAGRLTIMDVNTKEYWQSDRVRDLYPNEKERKNE